MCSGLGRISRTLYGTHTKGIKPSVVGTRRCFGVSLKSATHKATCIQIFYLRHVSQSLSERSLLLRRSRETQWILVAFGSDVEVLQISNRPQMWWPYLSWMRAENCWGTEGVTEGRKQIHHGGERSPRQSGKSKLRFTCPEPPRYYTTRWSHLTFLLFLLFLRDFLAVTLFITTNFRQSFYTGHHINPKGFHQGISPLSNPYIAFIKC